MVIGDGTFRICCHAKNTKVMNKSSLSSSKVSSICNMIFAYESGDGVIFIFMSLSDSLLSSIKQQTNYESLRNSIIDIHVTKKRLVVVEWSFIVPRRASFELRYIRQDVLVLFRVFFPLAVIVGWACILNPSKNFFIFLGYTLEFPLPSFFPQRMRVFGAFILIINSSFMLDYDT